MVAVEKLSWDSGFFKLKAGKLNIDNEIADSEIISALESAKKIGFDVIYIFVDISAKFDFAILQNFDITLVDTKIIYQLDINTQLFVDEYFPDSYKGLPSDLYDLAFQSGEFSRFKKDLKLGIGKFAELYKIWIDKSVSGLEADYVSVIHSNHKPIGFATVKIKNAVGVIGLIAVGNGHRGEGIGKKLMTNSINFLKRKGITKLEVATQNENQQACKFYESFGMTIKSKTIIYHLWYDKNDSI